MADGFLLSMFGFQGGHLRLSLHFQFISRGAVGVDGPFGEVVGAAAGWLVVSFEDWAAIVWFVVHLECQDTHQDRESPSQSC